MRTRMLMMALLLLPASIANAGAAADTVRVQNARLVFGFDARTGELIEMQDRTNRHRFITKAGELWQIDRFDGGNGITPNDAKKFVARPLGALGVELTWSEFGIAGAPDLRVVVTVRMHGDTALADWRIALHEMGALNVEQVHFPRVQHIARQKTEALVIPRWMGTIARDPDAVLNDTLGNPRRLQFDYPGALSLQLLALYSPDGPGFYAATDDTLAYRKSFAIWSAQDDSRGFEMIHPLENPHVAHGTWSPRYAAVLGTFTGDWYTAAEQYRTWGTKQKWARESRLQKNLVPEWLVNTGMWVWNRGESSKVLPQARALQDVLGLPVSVFWHWWHKGPYDTSFPDYLPPREGAEPFMKAVADADAAGLHAMVYMNQRLWCTDTPSWGPAAEAAAVKERDGKVRTEVYNTFDPKPCATMDVTQPYWRDKYAGIADTVVDHYGLHGIYMDQAVLSLICWDPTHGHPLGGGNYWMHGFEQLASQIRANANPARPLMLAGEGAGEPWLPSLDLMLTLQVSQERYSAPNSGWEPIPLFQAVYHAYGITYGSYSSLVLPPYDELWPSATTPADTLALFDVKFRSQFYLEQARSFVWGLQPTIANFRIAQLTDRPTEIAYMNNLAKLRAQVPEYLLRGTFMRPPKLEAAAATLDLSRVSIYAARRGGPTVSQAEYPAALAGAWRAADGKVLITIASIIDEPQAVSFEFAPSVYGLGAGTIEQIGLDGRRTFGTFAGRSLPIRLELAAGSAVMLEFRPTGR